MRNSLSESKAPSEEEIKVFSEMLDEHRYDFCKLVYLIFPFGEKGSDLEFKRPYKWQMEEWKRLSDHLMDENTRYETYRLVVSSGNGAAKTAFGAMTNIMLLYTQRLRGRLTANTEPQLRQVVWPEYDKWFRLARYHEWWFEKYGTAIKAKNNKLEDTWRLDMVTWSENNPASISGLHNEGYAICYTFEEAPGIPAVIWDYAAGAYTEKNTVKLHLAFGNSDDPESKFEQVMSSPLWRSRRIDTRELSHIDPKQIESWLFEAGGNEDHDDFRVRVRGLPRKSAKDSIISAEIILRGLNGRKDFDKLSVASMPVVLGCDPAWQGGDETCIWVRQGNYAKLLDKYKLKDLGADHMYTYNRLCQFEREWSADAVFIDQAEGTAIYTLANSHGKGWELVAFGSSPNDSDPKMSEYSNIRAQMYYAGRDFLMHGGVLDSEKEEWIEDIQKQLAWTKGSRHKITAKKSCESKLEIKKRVGRSPDISDGYVLLFYRPVLERKGDYGQADVGGGALKMPDHPDPYSDIGMDGLYD